MNNPKTPLLAIVVPCYNEEPVIRECIHQVTELMQSLISRHVIHEKSFAAYVDDGSTDATWSLIENSRGSNPRIAAIRLSKNFGHQNALIAGLTECVDRADITICIDADLQHDLDQIEVFVRKYQEGNDIVYGVKRDRSADSFFKRLTAQTYYHTLNLFGVHIIYNHADFRLMSQRAIRQMLEFREVNLFLRGMVPQLGFRSTEVLYDVKERFAGVSKYSLRRMLSLALDGITSFSNVPLRLVSLIGLMTVLVSIAASIDTVIAYYQGDVVRGWSSVVISIYFLGGVQMLCLGVIGEYIGKIYMEVKARPRYIVDKTLKED